MRRKKSLNDFARNKKAGRNISRSCKSIEDVDGTIILLIGLLSAPHYISVFLGANHTTTFIETNIFMTKEGIMEGSALEKRGRGALLLGMMKKEREGDRLAGGGSFVLDKCRKQR